MASSPRYIGSIDQGTSSSRFILYDSAGTVVDKHQIEITQHFPQPGWLEHEPLNILQTVKDCMAAVMKRNPAATVAGIGITNQRETTVVWDKTTGKPLYNALVWSDARTRSIADAFIKQYGADHLRPSCGLPFSTYFSAMKFRWLVEHVPEVTKAVEEKRALFGTIDTWLIWNLTNRQAHVTDVTNASRTMLMNLKTLDWDPETLQLLKVPAHCLPAIRSCSEVYGTVADGACQGVPLSGCVGDQQAAMLGQLCLEAGSAKNTYGTGCFMLLNTGTTPVPSTHGLLTTVCFQLGANQPALYALEGSVAVAGSSIQWLRDQVKLITSAPEIDEAAAQVKDTGGCYFVPAFSGLLSPHWRPDARGVLVGLTQFSSREHICRAVLVASAYQTHDVLGAMQKDSGHSVTGLRVDGGMARSDLLMQFQADLLQTSVLRPSALEATAAGAAYAAGLAVGFWKDTAALKAAVGADSQQVRVFAPDATQGGAVRARRLKGWNKAVERSFGWVDEEDEEKE